MEIRVPFISMWGRRLGPGELLRALAVAFLALGGMLGCSATRDPRAENGGAVHWMRSPERTAASRQVFATATKHLLELSNTGRLPPRWAVVIDLDETILDNSPYEAWMVENENPFSRESFSAWAKTESAELVPGSLKFLETTRSLGGYIAIVTNRYADLRESTRANLGALGVPFDVLLMRAEGATADKAERWRLVVEDGPGRDVVLWIGDQVTDFPAVDPGGAANVATGCPAPTRSIGGASIRQDTPLGANPSGLEGALAHFGACFLLLPNPTYGHWQEDEWQWSGLGDRALP